MSLDGNTSTYLPYTLNGLSSGSFSNTSLGNATATTLQVTSATPNRLARFDANDFLVSASVDETDLLSGTLTATYIPKATGTHALANSLLTDSGTRITNSGNTTLGSSTTNSLYVLGCSTFEKESEWTEAPSSVNHTLVLRSSTNPTTSAPTLIFDTDATNNLCSLQAKRYDNTATYPLFIQKGGGASNLGGNLLVFGNSYLGNSGYLTNTTIYGRTEIGKESNYNDPPLSANHVLVLYSSVGGASSPAIIFDTSYSDVLCSIQAKRMDNSESIPLLLQAGGGLTNIVGDLEVTGATTTNALTANGVITANDGITTSEPVLIGNRLLGSVDATPQGNFWIGLRGSATEPQRVGIAINGYDVTGIVNTIALNVGSTAQLSATSTGVTINNSTKALSDFYIGANSSAWNSTYTKGLYMRYSTNGGQDGGYIQSIDRSTSTRKPLQFEASSYLFSTGNVTVVNSIQAKNYARQNWNMNAMGYAGTPTGGAMAWKIATLDRIGSTSNFGQVMIKGMIGGWATDNQMNIDLLFGTRGSTLVMGTVNCPFYSATAGIMDIVYVINGTYYDVYLCVMSSTYFSFDLEVASSGGQSTSNVIIYDPSTTALENLPSGRTSITGLSPNYFTRNSRAFVGAGDDALGDGIVSNYNASTYASRYIGVASNGTGGRGYCSWFMNSYLRTSDGGALTATLRNDAGNMRVIAGNFEGTTWSSTTGVTYTTANSLSGYTNTGGHEWRHSNATQGIGIGYNTIYATGSNTDQELGLKAKGASPVICYSSLRLESVAWSSNAQGYPLSYNASTNRVERTASYATNCGYSTSIAWTGGYNMTYAFYKATQWVSTVITGNFSYYVGSVGLAYPQLRIYSQSTGTYLYYNLQQFFNNTYQHTNVPFSLVLTPYNLPGTGYYDLYFYNAGNCISDSNDILIFNVYQFPGFASGA